MMLKWLSRLWRKPDLQAARPLFTACPHCGCTEVYEGPSGGLSQNIECADCGARFNVFLLPGGADPRPADPRAGADAAVMEAVAEGLRVLGLTLALGYVHAVVAFWVYLRLGSVLRAAGHRREAARGVPNHYQARFDRAFRPTVRSITCPRCRRTSWNLNDVREGYCGACHDWTSNP